LPEDGLIGPETCGNSKIKCDFNEISGNLNFKIKVCVALEIETSGRVMYQCNRMLKYNTQ
jgi:hypothetical protein